MANNTIDYSMYECPYAHLPKEFGHRLESPAKEGLEYGRVWCACGFRGPVSYTNPDELGLILLKKLRKVRVKESFDKMVRDLIENEESFKILDGNSIHFSNGSAIFTPEMHQYLGKIISIDDEGVYDQYYFSPYMYDIL